MRRAGLIEALRGRGSISLILAFAYIAAGVIALAYAKDTLRAPDEFEYLSIGQNLALHGMFSMDGTTPTAWRAPGLPAIIAVFWWVWPSVYLIKAFGVCCWMATGYVIGRTAAYLHGAAAGYLAASLYLLYLYELYAATTLYPQTIAGLLLVLSVAAVVLPIELTPRRQLLLAASAALQILMIPNCIVVAAAIYPYAVLRGRIRLRNALAAGAVILLVILAWSYRNEQRLGGFSFTTTMGVTLYEGNRDSDPTVNDGSSTGKSDIDEKAKGLSEIESDKFYRQRSIESMKSHSWTTLRLTIGKFFHWFAYENAYATAVEVPTLSILSLAMAFIYYPVLIGSLLASRTGKGPARDFAVLSWLIYLMAVGAYVLFLTRIRYRLPFDTLLFCAAPGALLDLARRLSRTSAVGPATEGSGLSDA